jgi:hypothetical protein
VATAFFIRVIREIRGSAAPWFFPEKRLSGFGFGVHS